MNLHQALVKLVSEDFKGTNYTKMTLPLMKEKVKTTLDSVEATGPEKAIVTRTKNKIIKKNSKEELLMALTEQMLSLENMSM